MQLHVVSSSRLDEIDILNAMLIPNYHLFPQPTLLSEIPNISHVPLNDSSSILEHLNLCT